MPGDVREVCCPHGFSETGLEVLGKGFHMRGGIWNGTRIGTNRPSPLAPLPLGAGEEHCFFLGLFPGRRSCLACPGLLSCRPFGASGMGIMGSMGIMADG